MLPGQKKVYDRNDEQGKQSTEAHSADDYPANLMARFRTGTGRYRKWNSTQYHSACGHQDWP